MTGNIVYASLKYVFVELIGDLLYWPIWWYSKGLIKTALFCLNQIIDQEQRLGISVWLKNLFTPMFGQYDFEGRLISFFARLIQIIFRGLMLLVWAVLIFALFLIWLVLPIFIVYQISGHLLWLWALK